MAKGDKLPIVMQSQVGRPGGVTSNNDFIAHIMDTANPHKVTAVQVGAVDLEAFYAHEHDPNAHEEAHASLLKQLADHETRIRRLEDAIYNDITGNPHSYLFDTLEGIRVVSGVWNKAKSRLEC